MMSFLQVDTSARLWWCEIRVFPLEGVLSKAIESLMPAIYMYICIYIHIYICNGHERFDSLRQHTFERENSYLTSNSLVEVSGVEPLKAV